MKRSGTRQPKTDATVVYWRLPDGRTGRCGPFAVDIAIAMARDAAQRNKRFRFWVCSS